MKILVTGGAGFIGSHLVDHLLGLGNEVVVLDDFSTGSPDRLTEAADKGPVSIIKGSILEPEVVATAISGCEQVYHLAVQCVRRSIGNPMQNHAVNATGTLNVLEAARRQGVGRFVYCSSSEVYGNSSAELLSEDSTICEPVTVYGAAKLAGEHYTQAYHQTYGLPAMVVRPFNAYGPRAHDRGDLAEVIPRFIARALNGMPPAIFGDPSHGRDFTYVTEVAAGIAAAGACDRLIGDVINIAYGKLVTIGEIASTVLKLCQRSDLTPDVISGRPGDVHVLQADTTKARNLLGFAPTIGIEDGIETYLTWLHRQRIDFSTFRDDPIVNWTLPE